MSSRFRAVAALAAVSFALAGPALAAPSHEQAQAYVEHVPTGSRDEPVARWRDPICPLVAGLASDQAERLLERLSNDARAVGAPLGASDCHANLYIVAAADPQAAVRAWAQREPLLFGPHREAELQQMIRTERPVRVWRKTATTSSDGHGAAVQSQALFGTQGQASKPVLNWAGDSHLSGNTARYIAGAAIVLGPRVDKVTIDQLADYIALTSFAEVRLDGDLGQEPSILTLFRQGVAPSKGLSPADEAYLKALYQVQPNIVGQRTAIAERMGEGATR